MKLLERLLAKQWFTTTTDFPRTHEDIRLMLEHAFAVNCQPVAEWLYSAYGCTEAHPDFIQDGDCPPGMHTVVGDVLLKLPLNPIWMEWIRFDGVETGTLLLADPKPNGRDIATVHFLRTPEAKRVECIGNGEMTIDERYSFGDSVHPGDFGTVAWEILEASITFFHCKNVKIVTQERSRPLKQKIAKRYGITVPTFHTIEIHLRRNQYTHFEHSETGEKNSPPAHFVRGHFKRYDDGKLFGKRSGVWWWNMHIAGQGDILKSSYRTHPPDRRHARDCRLKLVGS